MHKTAVVIIAACAVLTLASPASAGFSRSIVFPLDGPHHFSDDFADPRGGGTRSHLGIDIIAAKMTPVIAATDGRISYVVSPQASWGYAIYLKDADGYDYRYLHLNNDMPGTDDGMGGEAHAYAPGIERGVTVKKGQLLGWVGDSGNAESVGSHLHFEMHDPQGVAFNPYESLLAATPPSALPPMGYTGVTTVIIVPIGGVLIKYPNDPKVYLLANDTKYHIADEYSFNALHFSWTAIRTITDGKEYRTGLPIQLTTGVIAKYSDGTVIDTTTAPPAPKPVTFTLDLAFGDRNEQVSELQRVLKRLNYYTYPTITGYFGTYTRNAVLAFQRAYGIEQVGYVGLKTRAVLNAL